MIIDGYNAIAKIRQLEAKKDISLEVSRMHFIRVLLDFMSRKMVFDRIFLVFDSKEKEVGVRSESYGDIKILYAMHDKDADNVIVDLLRKSKDEDAIMVASDDNFVRNHTRVYKKVIMSIKELEDLIVLKKKSSSGKIKDKELHSHKVKDINEELKRHWRIK